MRRAGLVIGLSVARLQDFEGRVERIGARVQRIEITGLRVTVDKQMLDRGFEAVRHLAQPHCAGQAGAALQRVQRAHARRGKRHLARATGPVAQARPELGQQLLTFFLEDREQLGVHRVYGVEVIVAVEHVRAHRLGAHRFKRQLGECLQFDLAEC